MLPSRDAPVLARRAAPFDRPGITRRRPVLVHRQTLLNRGESPFGCLPRRASECIVLRQVDEVPFVEESRRLVARGQWLGHQRLHALLLALPNLFPAVIAAISQNGERLGANCLTGLFGHGGQLGAVMTDGGDLVSNDQVMLRINRRLYVVAHDAAVPVIHGSRVRIGERDLLIRTCAQINVNLLEPLHLLFQGGDLLLQAILLQPGDIGLGAIGRVHGDELAQCFPRFGSCAVASWRW